MIEDGPIPLNIGNVCGGAVDEVFQREMTEVLKNIADPNTPAESKRKIVLEFTITPGHTREVAEIEFRCASKIVPATSAKGSIFLAKRHGSVQAFTRDPRQETLFKQEPAASPSQQ
jgi:hypothetical protein